jgi:hypothetical protein
MEIASNAESILSAMSDSSIAEGLNVFANDINNGVVHWEEEGAMRVFSMLLKEAVKRLRNSTG